jgi:hypothetical protein
MKVKRADDAPRPSRARGYKEQPSAAERRLQGRALRDGVPRESHGEWKPPRGRRDPVEITIESEKGRLPELVPIRMSACRSRHSGFCAARRS